MTSAPAAKRQRSGGRSRTKGRDLLVVANRLPVRLVVDGDDPTWVTSPGGMVTALAPIMRSHPAAAWLGWTGTTGGDPEPFDVEGMHLEPVPLSSGEVQLYYEGFSNGSLWPLYHDGIVKAEYHRTWWDSYQAVNRRFAERAAALAAKDGVVWVHDYHLQLVPGMLRRLRPDVRIGFFLHIPFPPAELFNQLPWRRQIIEGLLGSDVVGFQTAGGARNFRALSRRLVGAKVRGNSVVHEGREVRADVFPIGVDVEKIERLARDPAIRAEAARVRESVGSPEKLLLGIDRLDYTKGIATRIRAYRELLDEDRLSVARHTMIMVAEPTRENVASYAEFRSTVDQMVGETNGDHNIMGSNAIHYFHRGFTFEELMPLYLAADVMLVTPLRDGMNLVCKEFVASRVDNTGVLVLSEFTGAADSLNAALLVNPYDIDGLKETIEAAIRLPAGEASRRMAALRRVTAATDVHRWGETWLEALGVS